MTSEQALLGWKIESGHLYRLALCSSKIKGLLDVMVPVHQALASLDT